MTRINQDTEELQGLFSQMTNLPPQYYAGPRYRHRPVYDGTVAGSICADPHPVCDDGGILLLSLYASALPSFLGGALAHERDAQYIPVRCAGRQSLRSRGSGRSTLP